MVFVSFSTAGHGSVGFGWVMLRQQPPRTAADVHALATQVKEPSAGGPDAVIMFWKELDDE